MRLSLLRQISLTQPAFTCSKLSAETLEQSVKMFKINNKDVRTTPIFAGGRHWALSIILQIN